MSTSYYNHAKGTALLEKNTQCRWRPIHPHALHPNMCVATILPASQGIKSTFPLRSQMCYVPKGLVQPLMASNPKKLYEHLKKNGREYLKVIPAIKYSLEGAKVIGLSKTQPFGVGCLVVEGAVNLSGDLTVKPRNGLNDTTISINDLTGSFNTRAQQARSEFISSLKISDYMDKNPPILTIGSSLTDKISMASATLSLRQQGNSTVITASFIPRYYELETRYGLILEIQMGYEFSGKATYYPSLPSGSGFPLVEHTKQGFIAVGQSLGLALLIVFATPAASTILTRVAGGGLLLARP